MAILSHLKTTTVLVVVGVLGAAGTPQAWAFKAKHYPQCYAPIEAAESLVDKPKSQSGKKALGGLTKAAGMFGGFGGGLGKAANVAQKVQTYGGYVQSAASLSQSMTDSYPKPEDRWAAYSSQMSEDAAKLAQAKDAIAESQSCYKDAYDILASQVADGSLKAKKAKKPLKEIQKGTKETGDLLQAAIAQANNNGNAFGDALGGETQGVDVGQYMSSTASYCNPPALGMADWCSKYGSNSTTLTTDAFNKAFYSGNTAAAGKIAGIHRLNALAGLGGLSSSGLGGLTGNLTGGASEEAVAPSQESLSQLGAASEAYVEVATALAPLVETQKALEATVTTLP